MSISRTMKVFPLSVAFVLVASTALAKPPAPVAAPAAAKPKQTAQAAPTTATADPPGPSTGDPALQEARTRYNRGIELYNEGDYKLALIEFQRSYEQSPNWRILFNIGEVHYQLNNYALALKALEKYLAEGGKDVPAKRRTDVEKDIEALKSRTALLTVTANVEGAEVTIDDNPLGKAPLAPNQLTDSGTHRISATKQGYRSASKLVTLAGRESQSITLDLIEEPKVAFTQAPHQESRPNYVWVGWAATGALVAGATVTGILSIGAKKDLDNLLGKQGISRSEIDDADSKRKNLSIATDILAGAAIVTAGVSLYFTIKGSGSDQKQGSLIKPTVTPRVGLGSLGVDGTF